MTFEFWFTDKTCPEARKHHSMEQRSPLNGIIVFLLLYNIHLRLENTWSCQRTKSILLNSVQKSPQLPKIGSEYAEYAQKADYQHTAYCFWNLTTHRRTSLWETRRITGNRLFLAGKATVEFIVKVLLELMSIIPSMRANPAFRRSQPWSVKCFSITPKSFQEPIRYY